MDLRWNWTEVAYAAIVYMGVVYIAAVYTIGTRRLSLPFFYLPHINKRYLTADTSGTNLLFTSDQRE